MRKKLRKTAITFIWMEARSEDNSQKRRTLRKSDCHVALGQFYYHCSSTWFFLHSKYFYQEKNSSIFQYGLTLQEPQCHWQKKFSIKTRSSSLFILNSSNDYFYFYVPSHSFDINVSWNYVQEKSFRIVYSQWKLQYLKKTIMPDRLSKAIMPS